jgi:adenylylsulfate kinase
MAFAVWLTGLPASGKSSIAVELASRLRGYGVALEVLESDETRKILTPGASYAEEERDAFYRALAFTASRLVAHQISVIIDATANKRAHRELARGLIPHFFEAAIECPIELCRSRDHKGTYRAAAEGRSRTVPGDGAHYEVPAAPELRIDSSAAAPEASAERIVAALVERGFLDLIKRKSSSIQRG